MKKSIKILIWITSIFMLLSFISLSPFGVSNILFLVSGLIIMPPISKLISEKTEKFTSKVKWISFAVVVILAIFTCPSETIEKTSDDNLNNYQNVNNDFTDGENTKQNSTSQESTSTTTEQSTSSQKQENINTEQNSISQESTSITVEQSTSSQKQENSNTEQNSTSQESTSITAEQSTSSQKQENSNTEQSTSNNVNSSKSVYKTPTGKRYHLDPDCGGENSSETTLGNAIKLGLTPCKKCAQ